MKPSEAEQWVRDFNAQSPINLTCPYCGAEPLSRCRTAGGARATEMHDARWAAKFQQDRERETQP